MSGNIQARIEFRFQILVRILYPIVALLLTLTEPYLFVLKMEVIFIFLEQKNGGYLKLGNTPNIFLKYLTFKYNFEYLFLKLNINNHRPKFERIIGQIQSVRVRIL